MSFCPNCGTQLEGNPLFCPECGAYLMNASSNDAATPQAAVAQQQQPQSQQPHPQQQTPYTPPVQQQQPPQQTPYTPPVQQSAQQQTPYTPPVQQQGYTYDASAAQPVQEDKASIGLAILSFFIPLAGLILYFAKKKKSPKTAKACITAAVISTLLSSISSWAYNHNKDEKINTISDITITQSAEEGSETSEPETTTEAYVGDVYGKFDDKKYVNECFNIMYTAPDDFEFEGYDELSSTTSGETDENGVPVLQKAGITMYYDSLAFSSSVGSSIMTMCVPSGAMTKVSDLSEDELLDSIVEGASSSYDNVEKSDAYTINVAGRECRAKKLNFTSEGVKIEATYFALEQNGSYFVSQIITNEYDSKTADDYLKAFSTAK